MKDFMAAGKKIAWGAAAVIAALFILKWANENDVPYLGAVGDYFS